jgi:hypothetical protein
MFGRSEAHRLAQEARDMALKAETKIEQHETECGRRYGDLNATLRDIRTAQVENANTTQRMVGSVEAKVNKIVMGVGAAVIMGLFTVLYAVFSRRLGL